VSDPKLVLLFTSHFNNVAWDQRDRRQQETTGNSIGRQRAVWKTFLQTRITPAKTLYAPRPGDVFCMSVVLITFFVIRIF